MAADNAMLSRHLHRFYDFSAKVVLFVGAGGGGLFDPSVRPQKWIAIDRDAEALELLRQKIAVQPNPAPTEFIAAPFETVQIPGDVVYFEFCLHEFHDPQQALAHARTLAKDIVVFDHAPGSLWSFYAVEDELVRRSSDAVSRAGVRHCSAFRTEQRFPSYEELSAKLAPQGLAALARIANFAKERDITIPMDCLLVLL